MSRASAGRRERRVEKKKQLGRPPGTHKSLFKDQQRFAIAAWIAFMPDYGPHDTAKLVRVLIEEDTPIRIEDVEGLRLVISAPYAPPTPSADFDDVARQFQQKAALIRDRATGSEMEWLSVSASGLRGLIYFFRRNDLPGMRRSIDILRSAGWGKTAERVGRRLGTALRSNIPPRDDPVGPKMQRALDAIRNDKALFSEPIDTTQ